MSISPEKLASATALRTISHAGKEKQPCIRMADLCRPGLQFAGYFDIFAFERPQVIGKTTVSNIQAGILYGYIGSVEKIVGQMKLELGGADIRVIATGGMAHLVKSNSDVIDEINPDLTLTGLRLIYERNL